MSESVANGSAGQNSTRFALPSVLGMYRPTGNDGDVLIRSPRKPQSWNVPTETPAATRTRRRMGATRVFLSLSNRPAIMINCSFLKIWDCGLLGCGALCGSSARRGHEMAVPDNQLMDDPLHSVALRRELTLLDGALDKNVVALIKGHGDAREVTVKRQVVPVGVLLWLSIGILVPVTFAEPDIGDGRS